MQIDQKQSQKLLMNAERFGMFLAENSDEIGFDRGIFENIGKHYALCGKSHIIHMIFYSD